jgi:hypothetical protein
MSHKSDCSGRRGAGAGQESIATRATAFGILSFAHPGFGGTDRLGVRFGFHNQGMQRKCHRVARKGGSAARMRQQCQESA